MTKEIPTEVETNDQHEQQIKVFNPYSDLDRFRREAFIRIPGVVILVEPWEAKFRDSDAR